MPSQLVNLLFVLLVLAILLWLFVLQPAAKRATLSAALNALGSVLDHPHVQNGELVGTYAGHLVQARPFKMGLGRPSYSYDSDRVGGDTFTIHLKGLEGRHYWRCSAPISLNPFGTPGLHLKTEPPNAAALVARVAGFSSGPDPELEARLQAAGLLDQVAQLQAAGSPNLRITFVPSSQELAERRLERVPGFAGLSPEMAEKLRSSGGIECVLQASGGLGPGPQRFKDQLDILLEIVRINQQVNAAPPAAQPVMSPAAGAHATNHLQERVVGSWSNELLTLSFAPDGVLTVTSRRGRGQQGTWAIGSDGRLQLSGGARMNATAWLEDSGELTVMLEGMAWKLHRGP